MSRDFRMVVATLSVILAACRAPTPSDRAVNPPRSDSVGQGAPSATTSTLEGPDTTPPADVSHGEAPIGPPEAELAPVLARLAPAGRTRLHRIRLEMKHAPVTIASGVRYAAWTFGGTVPGPALHVRQGDTVEFTLVNRANIPHSMDFHAAEIAPSKYYVNVGPGDSLHYRFVARVPGAFLYHCGTAPVAMHIANGMYGAIIVDPATPRPKAQEFVFVQSEFYMTTQPAPDGTRSLDWAKLLSLAPDHIVFNGLAGQYASHPIDVRPKELLRLYLVNAGPNRISSFHRLHGYQWAIRSPPARGWSRHRDAGAGLWSGVRVGITARERVSRIRSRMKGPGCGGFRPARQKERLRGVTAEARRQSRVAPAPDDPGEADPPW